MKLCWPIVTLIIDFNYKVLSVTLSEIFMLHFNLRFASLRSFERVQPILSVCLASLNLMTLLETYNSVNALLAKEVIISCRGSKCRKACSSNDPTRRTCCSTRRSGSGSFAEKTERIAH